MYAKMRSKKNEPLSNLGKRTVRVTGKGPPTISSALVSLAVLSTETTRTAFPATSVEEIPTPISKRPRLTDKEKADSHPSSVWDDAGLAVEIMARHVHKIVQVVYLCNFKIFFLKALISFSGLGGKSSYHH